MELYEEVFVDLVTVLCVPLQEVVKAFTAAATSSPTGCTRAFGAARYRVSRRPNRPQPPARRGHELPGREGDRGGAGRRDRRGWRGAAGGGREQAGWEGAACGQFPCTCLAATGAATPSAQAALPVPEQAATVHPTSTRWRLGSGNRRPVQALSSPLELKLLRESLGEQKENRPLIRGFFIVAGTFKTTAFTDIHIYEVQALEMNCCTSSTKSASKLHCEM
ncbi:uncharacterized protein LOC121659474 [Corvus kubaryi]|uniref:uncharacterized protein LOC121659474 n=1 Tax=Corvus kubaryi TaxID=68294 RepID=UPI001C051A5E|nr:uncharacterized protein LOC121659474 [Corvus kubaryi]